MTDQYSKIFWDQNVRQFWVDEEIPLNKDKSYWETSMKPEEKDVYEKILVGLTLLDTYQGAVGMNNLSAAIDNLHTKAVLQFMGMMEQMHAKSYSSIFSTLSSSERIRELFVWVENQPDLQKKLNIVLSYYEKTTTDQDLFMAMVASVFLESFLFYSGFFYPLLLAGQGNLVSSAEIINLIIRDESTHGLYIGTLVMEMFKKFSSQKQIELKQRVIALLEELMTVERSYTKTMYHQINLENDVLRFIEHNANKALQNMGFESHYNIVVEDLNPIVLNGLKTTTKNHDFFSTKGNGYIKPTKIEEIRDEDFDF